jgi:hypothetical protein
MLSHNRVMATATKLEAVLTDRYRVSLLAAPAIAVLWAAERLAQEVGLEAAQAELTAANRLRERAGKMPAVPEYGTPLFHSVAAARAAKRSAAGRKAARTRAANRPWWMQKTA